MAFGFSFGKSGSKSSSFVDRAQQPLLDFIRNRGQTLAEQQLGSGFNQLPATANRLSDQLGRAGQQQLGTLANNTFLSGLSDTARGNQALINRQSQQLQQDLGQFYREQLLPGIQSDAIAVNQLGGDRQGVAEGLAGQGLIRAFQGGLTDILKQDAQRQLQAQTVGGGLLSQGAGIGLNSLESLYGLGMAPFQSNFMPLLNQARIVGPPTVLGSGKSSGFNIGLQQSGPKFFGVA